MTVEEEQPYLHPTSYRLDVQGLRAVAVLLVVAFHAGLGFSGGFVGVDVFFVISGFVITGLLRRELERSGSVRLTTFYSRRVKRLVPALSVLVISVVLASVVLPGSLASQRATSKSAIAAALSGANVRLYSNSNGYFAPVEGDNPLLHTWSLSLEEQFYLVFPVLLLLLWRFDRRWRRRPGSVLCAGLCLVAVVSLGVSCFATYRIPPIASLVRDSERFAFFLPVTRIWEFVAGAALAFGVERCATWERRVRVALSISGAAFILGAALVFDDLTPFPGFLAVIPVLGTVAMIAGGTSGGGPVRLLGSRPMVWIGDRSYGWYLWHWPLIVFVRTSAPARFGLPVVAAVVALGLAEVSHRFVEQPFRLDTRLGGRRVVALALACVGAPVVFASMVWGGANANWGVDRPAEWSDDRLGVVKKCGDLPNVRWNEACRFRVDGSRGVIILLGDSQAASLSDGFVAATNSMGYDAVVWFESGCPMLVGRTATDDQRLSVNRRCGIWQRKAIALVDRFDPSLAVVSNLSTRYTYPPVPDGDLWRTIAGADGRPTRDADDALKAWGEGFSALLAQFDRRSVSTVVVSPVPEYPRSFDERGLWFLRRPFEPPEITREYLDLRRSPTLDLEASIVASHPTAQVLDPAWALCTESRCRPVDDEGWLYMDNYHLNPRGSRLLEPGLVDAFQKALSNG